MARQSGDRVVASPLANKTAKEQGIDISKVTGSGPGGRVINADVLEARQSDLGSPASLGIASSSPLSSTAQYEDVANNQIRKVIAHRLTESKSTIPHYYVTI